SSTWARHWPQSFPIRVMSTIMWK
ncbi:iron-containing alcohol dehydrogenase family protein, partial [Vibrio parahaemolyticus V-223/04]